MSDSRRIIQDLGGSAAVAAITGARRNAVSQWYRIGIPAKYWPDLVDAGRRMGHEGITFDALRNSRPTNSAERSAA